MHVWVKARAQAVVLWYMNRIQIFYKFSRWNGEYRPCPPYSVSNGNRWTLNSVDNIHETFYSHEKDISLCARARVRSQNPCKWEMSNPIEKRRYFFFSLLIRSFFIIFIRRAHILLFRPMRWRCAHYMTACVEFWNRYLSLDPGAWWDRTFM